MAADTVPVMVALMGAIEAERLPADPDASERSQAEVRLSLSRYDFTMAASCRMLLAALDGVPAGYALVVRIPKPDARVGFLFVEELYVLAAYRRVGVASALLVACESVAREWGLHGVRLLVRPGNEAARELYRSGGFFESRTNFCEKLLG